MTTAADCRRRRPTPAGPADRVLAQLRANGGRVTASRRVTIEVLLGDGRHPNAGDIAVAVRARLPDVAESTAYRTLAASKNSA